MSIRDLWGLAWGLCAFVCVACGSSGDESNGEPGPPAEAPPAPTPVPTYPVAMYSDQVTDGTRDRAVPYTAYYPEDFSGRAALVLVSHGGTGSAMGHTRLTHLGTEYASRGYVAIHVGHLPSVFPVVHRIDRPADVSFLIDQVAAGTLPLGAFDAEVETSRVGHAGHSYGAYTAMALAGGVYEHGVFRDDRIAAVAPISPQGGDQFGAIDESSENNTWVPISIPVFDLVGGDEVDGNANGSLQQEGWRLIPFERFSTTGDKYQAVLANQDHSDMGSFGSPEVMDYIAINTRAFFDVYVRGDASAVCEIGSLAPVERTFDRKPDPGVSGLAADCPLP